MWQLIQLFQRTVLIPVTVLKILTDWLNVIENVSGAGIEIVNREVEGWKAQDQAQIEANKAIADELAEMRKQLAEHKAKSKVKSVSEAAKFTK